MNPKNLVFSYDPSDRAPHSFRPRRPNGDHNGPSAWTAPEHARMCKEIQRDAKGNIILDARPEMLKPRREVRHMF
jgi:hypothetical protein